MSQKNLTEQDLDSLKETFQKSQSPDLTNVFGQEVQSMTPEKRARVQENLHKLQQKTDTNAADAETLNQLQASMAALDAPTNPNSAHPTPAANKKPTLMERAGKTAEDIRKDFMEGSNWTKAGYIAGGVVGFLAARWLWRKAFGSGKKEGFIKKGLKWTLGIGAGIAGVLGLKKLRDYWNNAQNALPKGAREAAKTVVVVGEKGAEGVEKGVGGIRKNFDKAFGDTLPKREDYNSDEEYQKALQEKALDHMKNGGKLAMFGNTLYFMGLNGIDAACKLDNFAVASFNAIIQRNLESTGEWAEVYVEGAVLYIASFGVIDAAFLSLVLGPKAGVIRALKNTASWPYSILRKGKRTIGILTNSAGRRLAMIESKAALSGVGYNLNRLRLRELNPRAEWTVEHVEALMKEWKKWNTFEHELSHYDEAKTAIGHRKGVLADKLRDGLQDLYKSKKIIPQFLQKPEFDTIVAQIKAGQLDKKFFDAEAMKIMFEEGDNAVNVKPKLYTPLDADDVPDVAQASATKNASETLDDGGPARKLDPLPEEAAETTPKPKLYDPDNLVSKETIDAERAAALNETLEGINKVENTEGVRRLMASEDMQKILQAGNMDEAAVSKFILETLGDDAKTLDAISLSKRGRWMLKGAVLSGKLDEVKRVIKAGQGASTLAKTMNVAGFAGDAFGAYMAYCDYQEYGQKALDTQNIALQETYRSAQTFKMAEGAINAAGAFGFVVNGICIMKAGGSFTAVLGAPAGAVLVPIAIATAAVASAHKGLVESVEYHSLDQGEMLKKFSPGQMLEHVSKTDLFFKTNINWSQGLFVNHESLLAGNEGARSEAYRAYFAKIGTETIPAPDLKDCGDEALIAIKEGEKVTLRKIIEAKHKERLSSFVNDAMTYIKEQTRGAYTIVDATTLNDAMLYGREQLKRRSSDTPVLDAKNGPDQTYSALREARWQQVVDASKTLTQLSKAKEKDEAEIAATLLDLVRNELASQEQKILSTEYESGSRLKAWTNWKGQEELKSAVRGYIAESVWNTLRNETLNKTSFTPQEMYQVKERMVDAITAKQPYGLADIVLNSEHLAYYEKMGSNPQRLTVAGMLDMVKQYPLYTRQ